MIKEFNLFIEGIRWYEKGKLKEREINKDDTFFEVGDKVVPIDTWQVYKWHDKHATKHFQPGEEGFWDKSMAFKNENGHWVVERTIDFDKDGYEGQLIQLNDKYPWYQATGFKKV